MDFCSLAGSFIFGKNLALTVNEINFTEFHSSSMLHFAVFLDHYPNSGIKDWPMDLAKPEYTLRTLGTGELWVGEMGPTL